MKQQSRTILGLAVFYVVVVSLLNAFLSRIPVINWLGLVLAFVFFALLLLGNVLELRPTHSRASKVVADPPYDEVGHLAKTIDRALFQNQPEPLSALGARLKSLILSAYSSQACQAKGELLPMTPDSSVSMQALPGDEWISSLLKDADSVTRMNVRDVERLVAKIEGWFA